MDEKGPSDVALSTDDRIIHASFMLITEHGLGGVTMSQVADAAGVARQTLYNHYGNIDSIVAAMIRQHNHESIDLLEASLQVAESPDDKIEQMVRHFASVGAHSHHSIDLSGALAAEIRASLGDYQADIENHISAIIEEGQQAGLFRADLSLSIDTVLVRALLDGVHDLASRSPDQVAQISTVGTRMVLRGVGLSMPIPNPHKDDVIGS